MNLLKRTFVSGVMASLALAGTVSTGSAENVLKLASFVPPVYILHEPIFEQLASD